MKVLVSKSRLKGRVKAPASKSYTIRGLMCAALAEGSSRVVHPLVADDTRVAAEVLGQVGVPVQPRDDVWLVTGGYLRQPSAPLFCGESAATLRFMTAIGSLIPGECSLTGAPSLLKRPIEPLLKALRQLAVGCSYRPEDSLVVVRGGRLKGGAVALPGDISSQFVSALLLIAPLAGAGMKIWLTTPLESRPYVLMTLECLRRFGIEVAASSDLSEFSILGQRYRPAEYRVEGDWSSASYLLALGAVGGEVEVPNLNPESEQGDRVLLDFLRGMGAGVAVSKDSVVVRKSGLKALSANLADCIDLLPTLAVLAALAPGESTFTGIGRARLKESNRVAALKEGLERMGVKVSEGKDSLAITGTTPKGAVIDTRGDHRIALAFGVLGSAVGGTVIDGAECIAKTYPGFWDVLKSIGGEVEINGQ